MTQEQNIVQNIASVPPEGTPGFKCGCRGDDLPLSMPEWRARLEMEAFNYALMLDSTIGRNRRQTETDFIAGADFARNEMQKEIDELKKELEKAECSNYECKHEEDATKAIDAIYKLVERTDELKREIDCLAKKRDNLEADLILERGGSELFKRRRDEAIEALRDLFMYADEEEYIQAMANAENILKRYDK